MRHLWFACALLCSADVGLAQQAPAGNEAALPEQRLKYRVEFIVFAHAEADPSEELFDKEAASYETLPPALLAPDGVLFGADAEPGLRGLAPAPEAADPTAELKPILPFPADSAPPGDATAFWFRVLRADELVLAGTYRRLENLRAYHLLGHGGWIQDGVDEDAARPMNLANLGIVNPTGSLRLHVSRFLHLGVDLEYRVQPFVDTTATVGPLGLAELAPLMGTKYRMSAQRRARSGELHYVDHPMFGLLFLISPAPEENAPVEDDTAVLAPAI
jgi:hypothetical protein